ncbi:retinol binding protein receptor-domain-containing protein, partial [Jimgerdemannia flammicorona]
HYPPVNISFKGKEYPAYPIGNCGALNKQKNFSTYIDNTTGIAIALANAPLTQRISIATLLNQAVIDDNGTYLDFTFSFMSTSADDLVMNFATAVVGAMDVEIDFLGGDDKLVQHISTGVIINPQGYGNFEYQQNIPVLARTAVISIYTTPPSVTSGVVCFDLVSAIVGINATNTPYGQNIENVYRILFIYTWVNVPVVFVALLILCRITGMQFPAPVRMLQRQPNRTVLVAILVLAGALLFEDAWNLVVSKRSWLLDVIADKNVKVIGLYALAVPLAWHFVSVMREYAFEFSQETFALIIIIFGELPVVVAAAIAFGHFGRRVVATPTAASEANFRQLEPFEEQYVSQLFKKKFEVKRIIPKSLVSKIVSFVLCRGWPKNPEVPKKFDTWKEYVYDKFGMDPVIRIPLILISSLWILIFCQYQLILAFIVRFLIADGFGTKFICGLAPVIAVANNQTQDTGMLDFANASYIAMECVMWIGGIGGGLLTILFALGMLRRFTKDIRRIRKGDYGIFKGKKYNSTKLDDFIRVMGAIVGFGFTGSFSFIVELLIIGFVISLICLVDLFRNALAEWIVSSLFFISFIVSFAFKQIQKQITQQVFVASDTTYELRFCEVFYHYSFLMMIASFASGLTAFLLRMIKLAFRFPFYSLRIDRNIETWIVRAGDGGFSAWCGMLMAENIYNNPIKIIFLQHLSNHYKSNLKNGIRSEKHTIHTTSVDDTEKWQTSSSSGEQEQEHPLVSDSELNARRKRAKTRWFLAVTLINNPMLRLARKHRLDEPKGTSKQRVYGEHSEETILVLKDAQATKGRQ